MKKQVIVISWWVDYTNYENYEDFLNKQEIDPYFVKEKWWKDYLNEDLWDDFEVLKIDMPNKWFANYNHRKIIFEKYSTFFADEIILIWHSLGWSFIVKYLEENILDKKINSIHLVAPASQDSKDELLWSFKFDLELNNFKKYDKITAFYFSKDDPIVPFYEYDYFSKVLPGFKYNIFEDKWHFWTNFWVYHLPELVNNLI